MSTIDDHFAWIKRNHDEGSLLVSGPAADFSCGMLLMKAETREALDSLLASEPGIASGRTLPEVTEWEIHQFMGFGPFQTEAVAELWPPAAREALAEQRRALP
jgi:hypothetical protein